MEVRRILRRDKVGQDGRMPIRMVISFEGVRVQRNTGERTTEAGWNPRTQKVRESEKFGADSNDELDRQEEAARTVWKQARQNKELLTAEEFARRLDAELAPHPLAPPPVAEPAPPDFFQLWDRWVESNSRRLSSARRGQLMSDKTLASQRATGLRLEAFAEWQHKPLTLLGMNNVFYEKFRDYMLVELGQGVNTFGKHIRKIKAFLNWCVDQDYEVSQRYIRFAAPEVYVGVEALTVSELRQLQALDFQAPATREAVIADFLRRYPRRAAGERRVGQRESVVDEWRVEERLRVLEDARDCLLMCCYTGLRKGDVYKLRHGDVQGDVLRCKTGKTGSEVVVPFFDDDLFKPRALVAKYADRARGQALLPINHFVDRYLPLVGQLAGITRLRLTSKFGRKTFVTLKIYQRVPTRIIMQATGHKTESSFNRYAGVDVHELVKAFRKGQHEPGPEGSL